MSSPPARRFAPLHVELMSLLRHVLDDDGRTRRAVMILSQITIWLLLVSTLVASVAVVMLNGPFWVPLAGGGAATGGLALRAWWRARQAGAAQPDPLPSGGPGGPELPGAPPA